MDDIYDAKNEAPVLVSVRVDIYGAAEIDHCLELVEERLCDAAVHLPSSFTVMNP